MNNINQTQDSTSPEDLSCPVLKLWVRMSRHSKQRILTKHLHEAYLQITPLLIYAPTWAIAIVIYHLLFLMRKLKLSCVK